MSVKDLKAFGKKCAEDEKVRVKAKKIGVDNVDGMIAYAKELGFTITKADFQDLGKEAKKSNELSEEQLEKIAGGVFTSTAGVAAAVAAGAAVATAGIEAGTRGTRRW
jgi:predicted ribosomally synthesized peptide with nif11-like leader